MEPKRVLMVVWVALLALFSTKLFAEERWVYRCDGPGSGPVPTCGHAGDLWHWSRGVRSEPSVSNANQRIESALLLAFDRLGRRPARFEEWFCGQSLPHTENSPWPGAYRSVCGGYEEFMIDTSIVYTGAPYSQSIASLAFDGINHFVVWQDDRNGPSASDIYGARVHPSGALLDAFGMPVCTAEADQWYPAVAFDGTNYLVVWSDWRGQHSDIYGARVDTSGTVLDPSWIAISTAFDHQIFPSIAFDGTNYLVVWSDGRNGNFDVYGARISRSGVVLDPSGIAISAWWNSQAMASVGFDGTHYLVVWEDCRFGPPDIYGARVDPATGTVLDRWGIPVCTAAGDQWYPAIAFDGTNYLAAWTDERNGSCDIYGARIDTSGVVLDTAGIPVASLGILQICPSVAFDGTNYVAVWTDARGGSRSADIYAARVDTSGTVLDTLGIAVSRADESQWYASVAFGGSTCLMVWTDERGGRVCEYDIYGARMTTEGIVLDSAGILISAAANSGWDPSVAFDGINYLVVWEDRRTGSDIYGARVTATGVVLDPSGIPISFGTNPEWFPSVCSDGVNYLVAWTDWHHRDIYGDIYGTRVDENGTVLDPSGISICVLDSGQWCPSIAYDGVNYLVVWEDSRNGSRWDIYGTRVDPGTGTVLDPAGIAVCTDTFDQWSCSVAFDGTNYLVVWNDYRSEEENWDIYGARVDTSGTVLDTLGIAVITADGHQVWPSVAFDGDNYLVVWMDLSRKDIYGARVDSWGRVLPPPQPEGIPISTASGEQWYPSVAFYGTKYLVVWEDWRGGFQGDIYGTRVDASGNVLDPSGIELVNQPHNRMCPAVASGSGSQLLLAYPGFAPPPYMSQRIFGILYDELGVEEWTRDSRARGRGFLNVYPNPFATSTGITYTVPGSRGIEGQSPEPYDSGQRGGGEESQIPDRTSHITLTVHDVSGRLVRTLVDEPSNHPAIQPSNQVVWDGRDDSGERVGGGVYFCRLTAGFEGSRGAGSVAATEKLILLK